MVRDALEGNGLSVRQRWWRAGKSREALRTQELLEIIFEVGLRMISRGESDLRLRGNSSKGKIDMHQS